MSRRDVIAAAQASGLTMTEAYVSSIRSAARAKGRKSPQAGGGGHAKALSEHKARAAAAVHGWERQLAELVLDHGIARVEDALRAIRTAVLGT